jgi:hypothetical protein
MRNAVLFFLLLAGIMAPSKMRGQIDRAELGGTVTDKTGAVIADANVVVIQVGTNATRNVTTNSRGEFLVASLPVGRFTLVVKHPDFNDLQVAGIDLHAGDVRTLNEQMQPDSVSQTVSVEADASAVQLDKSNATFGGTIQSVQVQELPLNGRNIATLELLAPGAIDTGSGQQATIRFAGQGIDDTYFRFDGVDASGIYREALKSGLRLQFSTEAVSEFKVDAGVYTADTGGSAGGQVSLISKSGTNQLHGSAFEFLRNSFFDARSPIKAASYPTFHLNQFGGSVGGPIAKDRTFFFVDYEGFRQQLAGVPATGFVPSPNFRAQVIAAHPELAPLVNSFPQGTAPVAGQTTTYSYSSLVPSPDQENSGMVRVDHRFSNSNSSFIRYSIDDGVTTSALGSAGAAVTVASRMQNFVLEQSHIFSPTLLNEAEFGFNRNTFIQTQSTGSPLNIVVSGFSEIYENYDKEQIAESFSLNDTVSWTRGAHSIKLGADIRFPQYNEANSLDSTASFLSPTTFLANQLNQFQLTAPLPDKSLRKLQAAGFVEDEWKVNHELTVNYGIRYNYFAPFHEQHNNEDPFDIADCSGYCGIGGEFYHPNYLDFDPRVGLAYSPAWLNGKMTFRAGYGMYHGEDQLGDEDSPVVNTEPSTILTSSASLTYSYPTAPSLTPLTGLALTPRSMARHHPDAYTQQWTAAVQRALPGDSVLTLTYLGVKGTHLFRRSYTNLINPATGTRPLPQYPSEIDTKYNEGASNFNAIQINLNRQFHNGFFIAGNYMYSHALDDGSVGAGEADAAQSVNCFACEYASSDDDVRNTGNVSLVYKLPFGIGSSHLNSGKFTNVLVGGWSVNTLLTARAGLPINVTLSRSASALPDGNNVNQRPNRVVGVPLYLPGRAVHAWLNPAAFAVPTAGTWGSLAKNVATGPPLWQDDSTIEKSFRITERTNLTFRAEAFNLFNRAQYGQPGSSLNVGSNGLISAPASFGVITSTVNPAGLVGTGTPRELEFGLRASF